MDLTVNLAPSYRDLNDPTTRQNFEDTVEQKRVIDLIPCHINDFKQYDLIPCIIFDLIPCAEQFPTGAAVLRTMSIETS